MKKTLLIAIILLPFTVSAQKLLKPEIDRITGDTTFSTSKEKLYLHGNYLTQQGEAVECLVMKTGRSISLILIPQTLNEKSFFTVVQGQKAYLKLKDNSLVTLTARASRVSDADVNEAGGTVYSNGILKVPYALMSDDISKIKSSDLVFLRIETSIGNFDCDIKPKFSGVIMKEIELVTTAR